MDEDTVKRLIGEACEPLKKTIKDQAKQMKEEGMERKTEIKGLGMEIAVLNQRFAEKEANYYQDVLIFAPDHVSNVAAHILLFFCGDEPTEKPLSSHFIKMDEDRQIQFNAAFEDRQDAFGIFRTTEEWLRKFDGMIQNRNSQIHFRDWDALSRSVTSIRGLFLRHPNLRDMWKDEYFVIQDFEKLRANQMHKTVKTRK